MFILTGGIKDILLSVKFYDKALKMSAKLIVHKFETGNIFQYLQITIEDEGNESTEAKFSEWLDGRTFHKKKDTEKSSRLVVKIVSGNEMSNFNLELCATKTENVDTNAFHQVFLQEFKQTDTCAELYNGKQLHEIHSNGHGKYFANYNIYDKELLTDQHPENCNVSSATLSPLEYSLEKVKENNARIMENIQMLNRTLNYTKKKEILDISCPKSIRTYPCDTCGKCFVYETGLKRHYSMRHAITEAQPRWQVVWTCIECFQVWPQHDLALKHSTNCCESSNPDCVREIKTSLLLQCEFCEKVFTSIPRLLRHAKTHTTENNYECNACQLSFTSYRSAEEHWLLCPWLKTCYNFSLPRSLLCNSCDRKFRNYEQLYNHRYKIGHFTAKYSKSIINTYMYQCETCGQCFPSTAPLQVHKRQCHPFHDTVSCSIVKNYDFHNEYYDNEQHNILEDNMENY